MTEPFDSPTPPSPPSQGGAVSFFLVTVFRLLLLGVGSSLAFVGGMAIAFIYPDPHPELPWIERVGQQPFQPLNPQWWQFRPLPSLSPQERQQGQQELTQLQLELNTWQDRLMGLETKLGQPLSQGTIESRLQWLKQQLSGSTQSFLVTLPSDFLFEGDRITLNTERSELLNSLVADLRNYPQGVIRIAAYTDNIGDTQENLDLSLQQAQSVRDYLYAGLGDQYHFLLIGYGETRFLVPNDSDLQRQRNRRIEIAIE